MSRLTKRKKVLVGALIAASATVVAPALVDGHASAACSVTSSLRQTGSDVVSDSVRCLQSTLNAKGFNAGPVDGWFGPVTAGAVRAYQSANGLQVDGWVGRETRNSLGITANFGGGGVQVQVHQASARSSAPAPSRSSGNGSWTSGDCSSFADEAAAAGLPWGTFSKIAHRESGCNPNVWVVDRDDDGGGLFGFNFKGSMINYWPQLCGMSKGEVRGNVPLQMRCAKAAYDRSGLAPWRTTAG